MRVITGTARGRKLVTVEGTEVVRPTTDGVKEAIFSAIQFEIEGRTVLDLFAGSGQLGIEALSRGAKEAYFIDSAAVSIKAVRENLKSTGLEANCAGSEHAVFGVPEKHPGGVRHSDTRSALQLQDNSEGASAPC